MNIIKIPLKPSQITFLNNEKALYSCDMRAIGESMDHVIPAMWNYENLMPWVLEGKHVLVNDVSGIEYARNNKLIPVSMGSDPRLSIYNRFSESGSSLDTSELWVAVPHPDADILAERNKYRLNFTYLDFMEKNDKFIQKELLGDLTPAWHKVRGLAGVNGILKSNKSGYLKRRHGSGGFTVFKVDTENDDPKFLDLFEKSPDDWFFEEIAPGSPHSIQCVKYRDSDDVIIFGYSDQIIDSGKYFAGSRIKMLESLSAGCFDQLSTAIQRLSPVLRDYEGFFGLDFMMDEAGKVSVLEANIRLTAATVPTLLTNLVGGGDSKYLEDCKFPISDEIIILTIDRANDTKNILTFSPRSGGLGKAISFQLADCLKISKSLNEMNIHDLTAVVDKNVSISTAKAVQNFWPFGWTICFVLEDSHCVLSSWYLEKKVLIDIFSCNMSSDPTIITMAFADYFGAKTVSGLEVTNR